METRSSHTCVGKTHIRARQNIRWHFVVCFTFHWKRPHRKMSWNIGNWKAYSYFFDTGRAHSFRIPNTEKSWWTMEKGGWRLSIHTFHFWWKGTTPHIFRCLFSISTLGLKRRCWVPTCRKIHLIQVCIILIARMVLIPNEHRFYQIKKQILNALPCENIPGKLVVQSQELRTKFFSWPCIQKKVEGFTSRDCK